MANNSVIINTCYILSNSSKIEIISKKLLSARYEKKITGFYHGISTRARAYIWTENLHI